MATADLLYRLRADGSQLQSALKASRSAFSDFGSSAGKALDDAAKATAVLGAALVGLSVKAAGDFEQSIATAGAKASATADELDAMAEAAKRAGIESAFSAKEAADSLGLLAQAGLTVGEQITALPGLLDLASAGALDLAEAADIAIGGLKGFGLGVDEIGRVNDVLAKAANSANTSIQELGLGLSYAAPTAAAMGISIEEASSALGILSNAGIKGSRAGTSLNGILAKMVKVSDQLGAGLSAADIGTLGFAGSLEVLEKNGLTGANAMDLFGQEAGPGVAALLSQGTSAIDTLTTSLENAGGTAKEVAERQLNTMNGQLKLLMGSVETLAITLGQTLTPVIGEVASEMIEVTNSITENKEATTQFALDVADAVTDLAEAMKSLSPVLTVVGTTFGLIVDIAKGLKIAMDGLALGFYASATAGAFLRAQLTGSQEDWDRYGKMQQKADKFAQDITKSFGELGEATKTGAELGGKLADATDGIANAMQRGADKIRNMTKDVQDLKKELVGFGGAGEQRTNATVGILGDSDLRDRLASAPDTAAAADARKRNEQLKEDAKAAKEAAKSLAEEAKRVFEETRTPIENFAMEIQRLDGLFDAGAISLETYSRAAESAREEFEKATEVTDVFAEAAKRVFEDTRTPIENFNAEIAELAQLLNAGAIDSETYLRAVDGISAEFQKATKVTDDFAEAAKRIFEETRTPIEKFSAEIAKLDQLFAAGAISLETYSRAADKARAEFEKTTQDVRNDFEDLGEGAAGLIFDQFESALFEPFSQSLDQMVADFAKALGQMAFRAATTKIIATVLGASTGSSGGGGLDNLIAGNYADGGLVRGPGTATSDSIPARLSNGEFVVRAAAVQHYGLDRLAALNGMRLPKGYAAGGAVAPDADGLNVTVANLFSEAELERYLSSKAGERVIMNVLRKTGRT